MKTRDRGLTSSRSLRGSDVPSAKATWCAIEKFALTFSGYDWAGSLEKCADLANSTRGTYDSSPERRLPKLTLDELRSCLFFEQRRFRHAGEEPLGADQGTSLDVLWESEVDGEVVQAATWQDIAQRGFDPPEKFSAYLHTLRWNTVTSANPRLFQSPLRAGIEIMAYQLEPLRKALLLPRVNLFIADDLGCRINRFTVPRVSNIAQFHEPKRGMIQLQRRAP